MSEEFIKILDELAQKFGVAIDWTSENVVPYLQDLLSRFTLYEMLTSIMYIVVSLALVIGCSIGIPKVIKHANQVLKVHPCSGWEVGKGLLVLLFTITIGCCVICIICQLLDIVTCYTIPEKKIFEYINSWSNL